MIFFRNILQCLQVRVISDTFPQPTYRKQVHKEEHIRPVPQATTKVNLLYDNCKKGCYNACGCRNADLIYYSLYIWFLWKSCENVLRHILEKMCKIFISKTIRHTKKILNQKRCILTYFIQKNYIQMVKIYWTQFFEEKWKRCPCNNYTWSS